MNVNGNYRPMNNRVATFRGSDFLQTITVLPAPSQLERILAVLNISPSAFPGTRLTQLSQLYERYRFTSFRIRYVPAVPTTVACQLLLYLDTDPSDDPDVAPSVEALIRQGTAHTGSQQWNFNAPKNIMLPMRSDKQLYYTGDIKLNPRFSLQAKAFLIQVTNPVDFSGNPTAGEIVAGSLYIDWAVNMEQPQINPAALALQKPTLQNEFARITFQTDRKSVV